MLIRKVRMLTATLAAILAGCGSLTERALGQSFTRQGSKLVVGASGDFQKALDAAQAGETIELQAGAIYRGHFVLPKKAGDDFITIQSSAVGALPPGDTRVKPEHAKLMPKVVARDEVGVVTAPGAHHYRIIGVEFYPEAGKYATDLMMLGTSEEPTEADMPHDIEIDRCIFHGDPAKGSKRGVTFNGRALTVKNSHLVDFFSDFQDAQTIGGWSGPGPFRIINNMLEASGENIMFGGAAPRIKGLIPSDIEIIHNHLSKPERYLKIARVKNLFELKSARRVKVIGNIFENNWQGAQSGFAILFTVRTCESGDYAWAVVEDVEFKYNILKNAEGAFNIMGRDDARDRCGPPRVAGQTRRITIENNLFDDINHGIQLLSGAEDIRFLKNTFLNKGWSMALDGAPSTGVVVQNNLFLRGKGLAGNSQAEGSNAINAFMPGSIFRNNIIVGAPSELYPKDNFFPDLKDVHFVSFEQHNYRLDPKSKFRGKSTDKTDIGADFDLIEKETRGVVEGVNPTTAGTAR